MLRVEVFTRALRASQNVKRDACLVCSLCLSVYMGVFSEDVEWLAFFVWRSPSGVEKDGKMFKAPRNHKVRGRARRGALKGCRIVYCVYIYNGLERKI